MFLISNAMYPTDKAIEIARRFIKAVETPLPPFIRRIHVLTTAAGENGIKVLGIYEVDDDKVTDGIKEMTKYYVQFYDIEGFKYSIEPMLKAEEAIPLLPL